MKNNSTNLQDYIVPYYAKKICTKLYHQTQEAGEWKDIVLVAGIDQQKFVSNLQNVQKYERILYTT